MKDIKLRVPGTKRGDKIYMEDKIIAAAIEYARDLFAGNSDGHDFEHTMRVYRNAMAISETEDCDRRIVALAALLHDEYEIGCTHGRGAPIAILYRKAHNHHINVPICFNRA